MFYMGVLDMLNLYVHDKVKKFLDNSNVFKKFIFFSSWNSSLKFQCRIWNLFFVYIKFQQKNESEKFWQESKFIDKNFNSNRVVFCMSDGILSMYGAVFCSAPDFLYIKGALMMGMVDFWIH